VEAALAAAAAAAFAAFSAASLFLLTLGYSSIPNKEGISTAPRLLLVAAIFTPAISFRIFLMLKCEKSRTTT
jgi:hypothetical protein